jgi:hypothetical protein
MTLREKQSTFALLVAQLLLTADDLGYQVTLGEAWRSAKEAARLAATGAGIAKSLHCDRLAIDLNLFKNGVYLRKTEDYAELGAWWKKQHDLARWGGDFPRKDGNHFSLTHGGRK